MGEAAWRHFLKVMPDAYAYSENKEQEFIEHLQSQGRTHDKVGMIYRRLKDGSGMILSLKEFRERIEAQGELFSTSDDWGACGCFTEDISGEET